MKNYPIKFYLFLFGYFFIWILIPTLTKHNLDFDMTEQYVLGREYLWGYNHPPLSFWLPAFFFQFFARTDFNYYFLSQLNIIAAFSAIWLLSKEFLPSKKRGLVIVLLMLIPFFNSFATKYNANSALFPPWAFSLLFAYFAIFQNKWWQWLGLGFFCALTVLAKYFAFVLLFSILSLFFIRQARKRIFQIGPYLALALFLLVLSPHILWLIDNQSSIRYAQIRILNNNFFAGRLEGAQFLFTFPLYLSLAFIPIILVLKKIPIKIFIFSSQLSSKQQFLWLTTIFPWLLTVIISIIFNISISGLWASPIWLMAPLLIIYNLEVNQLLHHKKVAQLFRYSMTLIIIFASLVLVYHFSVKQIDMEDSFPSKKIAQQLNLMNEKNSKEKIHTVITNDIFLADNLAFYFKQNIDIKLPQSIKNNQINDIKSGSVLVCLSGNKGCIDSINRFNQTLKLKVETILIKQKNYPFGYTREIKISAIFI